MRDNVFLAGRGYGRRHTRREAMTMLGTSALALMARGVAAADGITPGYPGAYGGRAVHVHFKIRTAATGGRTSAFTSQMYFDDALTDRIYATGPYAAGWQRMRNRDDYLYRHGGPQLTVTPTLSGDVWVARFAVGLAHA